MIVFRGELSEENKKNLIRIQSKLLLLVACMVCVLIAIPVTLLTLEDTLFALGYVILPIILIGVPMPPPQKKWDTVCPKGISINDDSIYIVGDAFNHSRATNDIKKIIDTGDCYRIIFTFPNKSVYCLCQKDLIVEGTIEEFEERFADLIVRKVKG